MLTAEKYQEMGFKVDGDCVIDRHGRRYYPRKSKGPAKAIRLFCRECMGADREGRFHGSTDDIKNCPDPMCPLFDFRFGKNPFIQREYSEEERLAARARMLLLHKAVKETANPKL